MPLNPTFHVLMKRCSLIAATAASLHAVAFAKEAPASDEEAFLIRRIAEFWKDGDYSIVKSQIHDFVNKYPNSTLHDYLQGVMGDLLLQETQYEAALQAYKKIHDKNVHERILLNKLQCYYELDQYQDLYVEGEPFLKQKSQSFQDREQEFHFVMAESYFRHSLKVQDDQEKQALMQKSQPLYETLLQSDYSEVSSFALAEVYRQLKQNAKGAELYLSLAKKHPEKKESLLFNAAILQAGFDKATAIQAFDQIIQIKGSKAHEASYNRLLLYFQTENYQAVIQNQKQVYPYVPQEHLPVFNYIVGKCYYALGDFDNATTPIEKYLLEQKEPSDQYKDALLIQMTCAKQTQNETLFGKSLTRFQEAYPQDQEISKAHFMHAMLLKNAGELDKAEEELKVILDHDTNFSDRESLLYEYAAAAHHNGKYDVSYLTIQDFLNRYPTSERSQSAWRYFLSSCLHRSKDVDATTKYPKSSFYNDLKLALASNSGLTSEEEKDYKLLYAKLAYELGFYNESLEKLDAYVAKYPQDDSLAEAHLLTALSLSKLGADLEKFCNHLETAIDLNPESYDTSSIHLELYNAYLVRAEKNPTQPELMDQAAYYLYAALQDNSQEVKLENQLWLAGNFYKNAKTYLDADWTHSVKDNQEVTANVARAFELYSQALSSNKNTLKAIDVNSLYLEPEFLKYAEFCCLKGKHDQKLTALKTLIETQNHHPEWSWQFRRQALFELAKSYEDANDKASALESYQFINAETQNVATPITTASALKTAKLKFELMSKQAKNEKNPEMLAVLNQLKELQIRKNILSEPCHLEAALEYVNIRTILAEDNQKDSRQLFFLFRVKEDFTTQEDVISSEYHKALKTSPDKQRLYDAYMQYVDAEILRLQAKQLASENKKEEANRLKEKAALTLAQLDKEGAPTAYLQQQVKKSLKKIK